MYLCMYMGFQNFYPHYLLGFYCLSAHCSGSVLSRWQELFVSLPERSPQQSLPKVLNANINADSGWMLLLLSHCIYKSAQNCHHSISA